MGQETGRHPEVRALARLLKDNGGVSMVVLTLLDQIVLEDRHLELK
jgi:hypothetical protein